MLWTVQEMVNICYNSIGSKLQDTYVALIVFNHMFKYFEVIFQFMHVCLKLICLNCTHMYVWATMLYVHSLPFSNVRYFID